MISVLPWSSLKTLTRFFFVFLILSLTHKGFADPIDNPVDPVIPVEDDCNDLNLIQSDYDYGNPLMRTYRPSAHSEKARIKAMNLKFIALKEGREDGKVPVYAWYKRTESFACVTSYLERLDYFDMCGCYVGSVCHPVSIYQERTEYVLVKKWVSWKRICKELKNPINHPNTKQDVLRDLRKGNLYGLFTPKGLPTFEGADQIPFYDRYTLKVRKAAGRGETWGTDPIEYPKNSKAKKSTPAETPADEYVPDQIASVKNPEVQVAPNEEKASIPSSSKSEDNSEDAPPPPVVEAKNDFKNPEFKATPKTDELEGIPVEGKPGFFYSPYDNPVDKKHILDARGLSGRKVKDPWHEGKKITIPQVKKEE